MIKTTKLEVKYVIKRLNELSYSLSSHFYDTRAVLKCHLLSFILNCL